MDKIMEKINSGREYRKMADITPVENENIVEGYATTFNADYLLYDGGDYRIFEQVDARAFDECDMSDVIMQYDHQGRVFARVSNGTLKLTCDEHGLNIRADLSGTEMGKQLYEEIKGGYTNKMSFGFRVENDEIRTVEDRANNVTTVYRKITKISKLYDVSAVSLPANDATEISARSFCDGAIEGAKREHLANEERANKIKKLKLLLEV